LSLLTDQLSDRITADFKLSLTSFKSSHSNKMWSTDCSPFLNEHLGLSFMLYLYTYVLILPCLITNLVNFGVVVILRFKLSTMLGKNDFVIAPFEDLSHSFCHCLALCFFSSLNTALFGILL
jgi:hypothetical protein